MILVWAVLIGLVTGLLRAFFNKVSPQVPQFRHGWLVIIAALPQLLFFQDNNLGRLLSDNQAAIVLPITQFILLIFALQNWSIPGVKFLTLGLFLNLLVIVANGGLMPIRPEAVLDLVPQATAEMLPMGERLGFGKDIVLPLSSTNLWWLSDYFLLPKWLPYRVAYSMGDVLIALSAWHILWGVGQASVNPISHHRPGEALTDGYT